MLHPHPDAGKKTANPHHTEISVTQRRADGARFTVFALWLRGRVHKGQFDATSWGVYVACWSTFADEFVTIMTECTLIHPPLLRPQRQLPIVVVLDTAHLLSVRYARVISHPNMRTSSAARAAGVIVAATSAE